MRAFISALKLRRCLDFIPAPFPRPRFYTLLTGPNFGEQSIDQELARLSKDLELNPEQQQKVRPLLETHHDKIQALLDKKPTASRQELGAQIHAISDETHSEIHALLIDHQKDLEKAMRQREHNGEENRRSAPPAAASPEPSSSAP